MRSLLDWIQTSLSVNPGLLVRILGLLGVVLAVWLLRLLTVRLIEHRTEDIKIRYRWRKTTSYLAVVLGVLLAVPLWLEGIQSAATYLGLATAGLAIALKEPITNLAGWVFIL